MPSVFRLVREKHARSHDDLVSGEGARRFGGRWNHKGAPMIYTSGSVSLAALEVLVHSSVLPKDNVVVEYGIPTDLPIDAWRTPDLPADWRDFPFPASTQDLGTAWLRAARRVVLRLPSAVIALEDNWLLNPSHPKMARITTRLVGPFRFDDRLQP